MVKETTDTKPSISDREIVRLIVQTYGATQALRHYAAELRKQIDRTNVFIESNNPTAIAQGMALMKDISSKMSIILGDVANADEIESIKVSK